MILKWITYILFIILCDVKVVLLNYENIPNVIRFPFGGPFMGVFLAVAIPLELTNYNVYMSYNYEANYVIPENQTEWDYPEIIAKSFKLNRSFVYQILERKFKKHGFAGKECLLRTICEASEFSLKHTGVLADLLHIILTPSSSKSEGLLEYEDAEIYGREHKHCTVYKQNCSFSILAIISWVGHLI